MAPGLSDKMTPDSVDTLTELATILAQLRPSVQTSAGVSAALGLAGLHQHLRGSDSTPAAGTAGTPVPPPGSVAGSTPLPSTAVGASGTPVGTLGFKELPAATDNLKHKLQRARMSVRSLPDVSRSLAQQQQEIDELEALKARQLAQLAALKRVGLDFGTMG